MCSVWLGIVLARFMGSGEVGGAGRGGGERRREAGKVRFGFDFVDFCE